MLNFQLVNNLSSNTNFKEIDTSPVSHCPQVPLTASLSPSRNIPYMRKPEPLKKRAPPIIIVPPPPLVTPEEQAQKIIQQAQLASQAPDLKDPLDHLYHVNEKPGTNQPDKPKVNKLKKDRSFRFTDMMPFGLDHSIYVWKRAFEREDKCCLEWLVMGLETCPTTKKLHLQGSMHYTNPRSMSGIIKEFKNPHEYNLPLGFLAVNDGTCLANRKYCLKGDVPHDEYMEQKDKHPNYGKCVTPYGPGHTPESKNITWWEFGKCPMQGERTDIEEVATAIKERKIKSIKDLYEQYPVQAYKYEKGMSKHINYMRGPRTSMTSLELILGPPGSGKSFHARLNGAKFVSICGDYKAPYLQGWDGEEVICIDDFDSNQCSIQWFFKLIDENEFTVNTKFGDTNFNVKKVYITSNVDPKNWWPNASEWHWLALDRRIENIIQFEQNPLKPQRKPMKKKAMVDYSHPDGPKLILEELGHVTDEETRLILEFRAAKQGLKADKKEALQDVIDKQVSDNKYQKDLTDLRQRTGNSSAQLFN